MFEDDATQCLGFARSVSFIDCQPVRTGKPLVGERALKLFVALDCEVDTPLLFTLDDSRRLVLAMLRGLDHHGDERAHAVLAAHFADAKAGSYSPWVADPRSKQDETIMPLGPALTCDLPPVPPRRVVVVMSVRPWHSKKLDQVGVVCGLANGAWLLLMVNRKNQKRLVFRVKRYSLLLDHPLPEQRVSNEEWDRFVACPPGTAVLRGRKAWIKLSQQEVGNILGDDDYILPPPKRRRKEK